MVFSSTVFLFLFLPTVLIVYFFSNQQFRNYILLLASLFFYAWGEIYYVFLMILTIAINYISGLLIYKYRNKKFASVVVLSIAVIINLLVLLYYKYFNFILDIFSPLRGIVFVNNDVPIHLPIGISFYTFQNISYLVDLYRKEVNVQRNPFHLALYISLFPQLIAGPIIRYHDVDEQILQRTTTWEKFYDGFCRFFRGLGKKVLIANTMAMLADDIFKLPAADIPGVIAWLGIVCYSLQIYFDFSGYSDMAIGLGKMFGFTFLENFNYPYISKSIQEFWRRWHISLSSWFRDYVYIPLGGSRNSELVTYRNLLIVFFLTGLWHGASWNFILWGFYHGFFIILERLGLNSLLKKSFPLIQHVYALLIVMIGWVFFRAMDISYASEYIQSMFGLNEGKNFSSLTYVDNYTLFMLVIAIIFATPLRIYLKQQLNIFTTQYSNPRLGMALEHTFIYIFSLGMLILSVIELAKSSYNPFIYFRF